VRVASPAAMSRSMNNDYSDTKQLADALTTFATRLTVILTRKLEVIGEELERKVALKAADAMLAKPEVAKHFGITVRTLENWMVQGYVPYLMFGRVIRFSLADVQRHVEKHHRICRLRV
jgi:excisionase family DNA binding protein